MDANRFDALARALTESGTRRGLLRFITGLPLLGGLAALLGAEDDAEGKKNRRKRRKKPHKRAKRHRQHRGKRKCRAHPRTQTCAGRCGTVKNNCKKTVNCGSCACTPTCPVCQTCAGTPDVCVPADLGEPCGEPGQVCQADGTCACSPDPNSCPDCQTCGGDGACAGCEAVDQLCCDGQTCVAGVCCDDTTCLDPDAPDCVGHLCVCAGNADEPCQGDETCCADGCADLLTDPDHCGDCATACGQGHVCAAGVCEVCVCASGPGCFATVQEAIDAFTTVVGDTVRICAGTFSGGINLHKALRLIGAGEGADGAVLQGGNVVIFVTAGTAAQPVELSGLRIQGGQQGIINGAGHVIMTNCTVRDNAGGELGGGIENSGGDLQMTDCTIEHNIVSGSSGFGGGILNRGGLVTLTNCHIRDNTANQGGGIYSFNPDAEVHLIGTQVTDNEALAAGDPGGGIFNVTNGSTVSLDADSHVCANTPLTSQCEGFADPHGACQEACPPT